MATAHQAAESSYGTISLGLCEIVLCGLGVDCFMQGCFRDYETKIISLHGTAKINECDLNTEWILKISVRNFVNKSLIQKER